MCVSSVCVHVPHKGSVLACVRIDSLHVCPDSSSGYTWREQLSIKVSYLHLLETVPPTDLVHQLVFVCACACMHAHTHTCVHVCGGKWKTVSMAHLGWEFLWKGSEVKPSFWRPVTGVRTLCWSSDVGFILCGCQLGSLCGHRWRPVTGVRTLCWSSDVGFILCGCQLGSLCGHRWRFCPGFNYSNSGIILEAVGNPRCCGFLQRGEKHSWCILFLFH